MPKSSPNRPSSSKRQYRRNGANYQPLATPSDATLKQFRVVKQRKSKATIKNNSLNGEGVFIGSTDDNRQSIARTTIHDASVNYFRVCIQDLPRFHSHSDTKQHASDVEQCWFYTTPSPPTLSFFLQNYLCF